MQPLPKYVLAPYVATPHEIVVGMVELAKVGADDLVYDIGCGDGRIALAAVGRGARAFGCDVEQSWIDQATADAAAMGVSSRVVFERCDAMFVDLRAATVVLMYLVDWSTRRMAARILAECVAGTRVVSHSFELQGLDGSSTHEVLDASGHRHRLHLWVHPGG